MEFRMLGPLEAWHDGKSVSLGDQQQLFVLVVLLLHANKPLTPERIAEVVWGDVTRRDMVRTYVKRLRDVFRGTDVVIDRPATGYLLRIREDQLDTVRFTQLRVAAEAARTTDPRGAVKLLREAVDLWRGRFLEDIDIDRVGGIEVSFPEETYPDAVGDLADLEIAVGDHRSARDRMRIAARNDPANQRFGELLMRALIVSGDPMAARRVFHTIRKALAGEGMEPGPRLRNLHARAEHGEPPSSLPSRSLVFTGRDAELAAIAAARQMAWVSGAPGVGKTGLAIEAAYRLRDRYPDGQLMVELNGFTPGVPATTVGDALSRLLTELGVPPEQIPATDARKGSLYQTTLYGTKMLLVLDNAASPDQIRPLLPEEQGCFTIVTSRRMGEPDTGEPVRLSPLPPEEAAALFRRLTDTPRTRGRSAEVAEVVDRCGFLPVYIQVMAGLFRRHDGWTVEHLLRLLKESGPWGAGDGSAALRVSYQQLDEQQGAMFRLLGDLPGPDLDVTAAAALADCDVTRARMLLDELHEVCLVEEGQAERYRMLDPLKEFAAGEKPATPDERTDAMVRLLDFYLVTLTNAVDTGYPFDRIHLPTVTRSCPVAFADGEAARQWIAAERNNVVAAIHYAATHDQPEHAWRPAVLMWRYFNATGHIEDWIATLERAWEIVAADPANEYGQAHVLLRLSIANDRLGRLAEALELAAQALPKWIRLGDVRGEAATLCALAIPTIGLGRHDDALAHLDAGLAKYKQVDDARGQAHALGILGYLNELLGNLDTALHQHQSAIRISREIGDVRGVAHTLSNLGSVQQKLGHLEEALVTLTEAHRHATEAGDRSAEAYVLNDIGNVHRQTGRLADAARYQERARLAAAEVKDADLLFRLYLDRGVTAQAGGDLAAAFRACHAALDQADGTRNPAHQAEANHAVAGVLHAMGRHEQAVPHWDAAESGFTTLDFPEVTEVRAERAAMACACGTSMSRS